MCGWDKLTRKRYLTVVGVDGDPVLVAQVLPGSVSQMDGDTGVYSGQLCWGSELLGTVMPLKTDRENNYDIGYIGIANWNLQGCDFSTLIWISIFPALKRTTWVANIQEKKMVLGKGGGYCMMIEIKMALNNY